MYPCSIVPESGVHMPDYGATQTVSATVYNSLVVLYQEGGSN